MSEQVTCQPQSRTAAHVQLNGPVPFADHRLSYLLQYIYSSIERRNAVAYPTGIILLHI